MYRSLYAFKSKEQNSLPFAAGESFLILERSNQHWWLGSCCSTGETGYIPASYLEKIPAYTYTYTHTPFKLKLEMHTRLL